MPPPRSSGGAGRRGDRTEGRGRGRRGASTRRERKEPCGPVSDQEKGFFDWRKESHKGEKKRKKSIKKSLKKKVKKESDS